jgi:hypothetical protein
VSGLNSNSGPARPLGRGNKRMGGQETKASGRFSGIYVLYDYRTVVQFGGRAGKRSALVHHARKYLLPLTLALQKL